jgi:anti-sigma B factor antagonist
MACNDLDPPSHQDLLDVNLVHDGEEVVLEVTGEIDVSTAPLLEAGLRRAVTGNGAVPPSVCVDLSRVTFIDSTGLAALVLGRQLASDGGGTVIVTHPSHIVRRVLTLAGLDAVFGVRSGD